MTLGCTDQGADQIGPTTTARPSPVEESDLTPAVPVDDSPFCRTLLGLDDEDQPPTLDQLTAAYVDLVDDVPPEILPEFLVVLGALTAGDGGPDPALVEPAAEALADFVSQRCRGTAINPLPAPTVPN